MATYGYTTATAYVKGGMPVEVEGAYEWDVDGIAVTDVTIRWANTGKPVTAKFENSLSWQDWDAITDAIAQAAGGY